jgi:transketolase
MEQVSEKQLIELQLKANTVRQLLMTTLLEAKSGHSAGPLGMADIFTALYFHLLHHDPTNPEMPDRDRLLLSNGHICPVRYVTMATAGYFPIEELKTLRKINSRLQGHPHRTVLPGLETTSGPLGEGLSQGVGIALAARLDQKSHYVYVLTSDGEHQEGSTWEAAMSAGKWGLDHLIQIIDYNDIQIDGPVSKVMPLEPFRAKYEAFNWHVIEVDGNDMAAVIKAVEEAKQLQGKPTLIMAHTNPGKGVSFMERDYTWHGKPPNAEEAEKALTELKKIEDELHMRLATV